MLSASIWQCAFIWRGLIDEFVALADLRNRSRSRMVADLSPVRAFPVSSRESTSGRALDRVAKGTKRCRIRQAVKNLIEFRMLTPQGQLQTLFRLQSKSGSLLIALKMEMEKLPTKR